MKKNKLYIILIALVVTTTSCMNTRLVAKYDSDNIIHHKAIKVTYLWGAIAPRDIQAECESKAICQVSAKTNIGFIAISFITLGIVVPQTVIWDCCGTNIREEEFK